jgi:hypothetical protein
MNEDCKGGKCPHCGTESHCRWLEKPTGDPEKDKETDKRARMYAEADLHHSNPRQWHKARGYSVPKPKKKGQDWSNADGDKHGMYNQDTDEGGMGKHKQKPCKCGDPKCKDPKCKKREVGTGHGAEENNSGEVGWSGSGSPYPKKKGEEEDKYTKNDGQEAISLANLVAAKRKRRKKKAVITNVHSRLKNIQSRIQISDFLLRGYRDDFEDDKEEGKDWEQQKYKKPRKKKAVITNILSRLKSLDFLLRDGEFGGMNTGEVEHTEPRDTANSRTKRDKDVA